ncbi:hypothetical protein LCGC14_2471710 [marine sediment metagenome]|uniref:Nucleoside 2-deoxyribosyltransferase n=1 Tax=marine sediment metagenome TaxID=412755 RepID=A0A0F9DM99_9ZZZZ
MKVYLCGPMTGETYDEATKWRNETEYKLNVLGIETIDPFRGKAFLEVDGVLGNTNGKSPLESAAGIVTRDCWDVSRCDVLLVNFTGAKIVSIGSCFEIAWAYQRRIPIVIVMEEHGNVHDHCFIDICSGGFRVNSLDAAIELIERMS